MTETAGKLLDQVLELDADERLRIADALYASIEGAAETTTNEVAAAWRAEIERRRGDIDAGRVTLTPTAETVADLRRELDEMRARRRP